MFRTVILSLLAWVWAGMAVAQPLTGLARAVADGSHVRDLFWGGTEVVLSLSQGVPYRVFVLEDPPRLIVDFSEVDFSGLSADAMRAESEGVTGLRFGPFQPGWSRLVADLSGPMLPQDIGLSLDEVSGRAVLKIVLKDVEPSEFSATSGVPDGGTWDTDDPVAPVHSTETGAFTVVLDPGHGGIDPGAERDGLVEKEIVLEMARRLRDALRREGLRVVLTRDADVFVSLERRTAIAHRENAALFVSIHADALSQGGARGATVYTLSEKASDAASEQLAARHNRSDVLAGVDLTGADDEVTGVLLDMARRETEPRSRALAQAVIGSLSEAGGPMNRHPWRKAGFSVLKSADIPSVLVEIGFLSSERDRKNLANATWRAGIAQALAQAILRWRDADAARAQLIRQ